MLEAVLALAFGLIIGSFLNVCIWRLPRDMSVVRPRSHCPACGHPIAWYDNVPLASYLLLTGRCRHCRAAVSLRYPLVEMLTGLLFLAAELRWGLTVAGGKWALFAAILVALVFTDLETRLLPDEFTLAGIAAGLGLAWLVPVDPGPLSLVFDHWPRRWTSLAEAALAAWFTSAMLWSLGWLYHKVRKREGLGFGDVKMAGMIGAFLGLSGSLMTLVLGSVGGSVTGLAYVALRRKQASTYELPFGTFLGLAALAVAFLPIGGR